MRAGMAFLVAGLLAIVTAAHGGVSKAPGGLEFSYVDPAAFSVSLAGSFNNWDANANPMTKDAEGTWRVVLALAAGKHEYKFVVNGGTWMADPDNPRVVGDYGNSEVEINAKGEPVAAAGVTVISNTAANARVMITGWFRGTYSTRKDARAVYGTGTPALGDARWRLSRPAHEMYIGINPTVGSEVKGSATLRIDTGTGDIREIRTDLYSARLTYEKSRFDVAAYHNEEILSLDDPLRSLGHQDLPGTPVADDVAFGRGAQGVAGTLRLAGAELSGSYSNVYDYDIYNSPLRWQYNFETEAYDSVPRYDNVGTDVLALRGERAFRMVTAGVTYLSKRNGWWIPFDGRNTSAAIDEYKAATLDSASFWFEMGTSDWLLAGDLVYRPADWVEVSGAYGKTSYEAKWDAGNMVRKQGGGFVDGKIDVPVGDTKGTRGKAGVEISQGDRAVAVSYERTHWDGMDADEVYVTMDALPFDDPDNSVILDYGLGATALTEYNNKYVGVQSLDWFIVSELQPLPERTFGVTEVTAAAKLAGVDLRLGIGVVKREWKYAYGDSTVNDLTWVRVTPSVAGSLLDGRLTYGLTYDRTTDNISGRMPLKYDLSQLLIEGGLKVRADWRLCLDLRRASYDWGSFVTPADEAASGLQSADKTFINPYLGVVWEPTPRVEVRLGYGLNPLYYRDTPVEGRGIGRERYMASYLWLNPTANLIDAEEALDDLKMVSLMGVIAF
jgi:hypothetical protein